MIIVNLLDNLQKMFLILLNHSPNYWIPSLLLEEQHHTGMKLYLQYKESTQQPLKNMVK